MCGAYGGTAGYFASREWDLGPVSLFVALGFLVGAALSGVKIGRNFLRITAALQATIAILVFRMFVRGLAEDVYAAIARYIGLAVTLPGLVVALGEVPRATSYEQNLPAGYEHVSRIGTPMPVWKRLSLVLLISVLLVVQMFSAALFLMIVALPVVFACHYVIQLLRTRRSSAPPVARRMAVPSQRERPAQSRSHWTINPDQTDEEPS